MKIRTRFKGATDTTGAKIVATGLGRQKSICYPYELSGSETHRKCALEWVIKHLSRNGWGDTSRFDVRILKTHETGYTWEIYNK
jgi:hypothetical protein